MSISGLAEYQEKRMTKVTWKDVRKIQEMHSYGYSRKEINKALGIPYPVVVETLRYGWPRQVRPKPVKNCEICGKFYYGSPWSGYCPKCLEIIQKNLLTAKDLYDIYKDERRYMYG